MRQRTQLYLDDDQRRWLRQRAGSKGSIAAVVRELIDDARSRRPRPADDPLIKHLLAEPPDRGSAESSVTTIDEDIYGT